MFYKVTREIELHVDSQVNAASKAREIQLREDSHATRFIVERDYGVRTKIDLLELQEARDDERRLEFYEENGKVGQADENESD
jgi:hypothetical protein